MHTRPVMSSIQKIQKGALSVKIFKKWSLCLSACLLLTGCAALLERSYSVVEPYSNRYWDSSAEDTLRAENHQDLVNSLLMLVEQRAEEGVIRCYGAANSYPQIQAACREVSKETAVGAYLLDQISFRYESGNGYGSVVCRMDYREDAENPDSIMALSDSQSLVDLLRLAVREEHTKLTARFTYNTPRETVEAAVESLWTELAAQEEDEDNEDNGEDGDETDLVVSGDSETDGSDELPEVPSCPWDVRFYPDTAAPEIVEIMLADG